MKRVILLIVCLLGFLLLSFNEQALASLLPPGQPLAPNIFSGEIDLGECVTRGQRVDYTSNETLLCSYCPKIAQLKADFSPAFLNIIRCSDGRALSGYGLCKERYSNFNVLNQNSMGQFSQYNVAIPVSCEPIVVEGSPLYNLVRD